MSNTILSKRKTALVDIIRLIRDRRFSHTSWNKSCKRRNKIRKADSLNKSEVTSRQAIHKIHRHSTFHTAHFCTVHLRITLTTVSLSSCFLPLFSRVFMCTYMCHIYVYYEYQSKTFLRFNTFTGFNTITNHHLSRLKNYCEVRLTETETICKHKKITNGRSCI